MVFKKDLSAIRVRGHYRGPIQVQSNALAALKAIDLEVAEEVMKADCITGDQINGLVDGVSSNWHKEREMEIQHIIHECPLTPFDNCNSRLLVCELCRGTIWDESAYGCSKCDIFLHKSCAELPREINHPFHPQHHLPLTLIPRRPKKLDYTIFDAKPVYIICDACGCLCSNCYYHCSHCDFDLDLNCASLMPITNHDHELPSKNQTSLAHPHPLIHCVNEKKVAIRCSGCVLLIGDTAYVCFECQFVLHESCAGFQYEIQHPFHPQHPLVLTKSREPCNACLAACFHGFVYRCGECEFNLHTECASLRPRVKFKLHRHPLAFFWDKLNADCKSGCVSCGSKKRSHLFRCVDCDFNLHLHCAPTLPLTGKHRCHRHTLTFTKSPVKDSPDDDDDTEMYCDACEEERYLRDPTYYCAECHFVAHVLCMISEEDIYALGDEPFVVEFEREREKEAGEKSDTKVSKLPKLDKEIETLTAKLETLEQERNQHISSRAQLRSS